LSWTGLKKKLTSPIELKRQWIEPKYEAISIRRYQCSRPDLLYQLTGHATSRGKSYSLGEACWYQAQVQPHSFTKVLLDKEIKISMDGRGRALDNIFVSECLANNPIRPVCGFSFKPLMPSFL
jgi:hypothetical protein